MEKGNTQSAPVFMHRRHEEIAYEKFVAERDKVLAPKAGAIACHEKYQVPLGTLRWTELKQQQRAQYSDNPVGFRLKYGYHRDDHAELSGHWVRPVSEEGLRSNTLGSKAAEMWPALVNKASTLRTNWGKSCLRILGSKLLALDQPYVEGNRTMLGFIRIDTDRVWPSPYAAQLAFEEAARDGKIACAPHFLVGLQLRDGSFIRPHAIWLLPYGSAVLNKSDSDGFRRQPLDLFRKVYLGLCEALLDLGADPAAPATTQQVKNPLSPEWHTVCPQDHRFPSLSEHAEYVNTRTSREKLTRAAAEIQSGLGLTASNEAFNAMQDLAFKTMRQWHFDSDNLYWESMRSGNRKGLVDRLHVVLEGIAVYSSGSRRQRRVDVSTALLRAKVADFTVYNWDHRRMQRPGVKNGRLKHVVAGMTMTEARQEAGRYAASARADKTLETMVEAYDAMSVEMSDVSKKGLARLSGLGLTTVKRRWADMEAVISSRPGGAIRSIDKKLDGGTTDTESSYAPSSEGIESAGNSESSSHVLTHVLYPNDDADEISAWEAERRKVEYGYGCESYQSEAEETEEAEDDEFKALKRSAKGGRAHRFVPTLDQDTYEAMKAVNEDRADEYLDRMIEAHLVKRRTLA